jgi:hypothetical protein
MEEPGWHGIVGHVSLMPPAPMKNEPSSMVHGAYWHVFEAFPGLPLLVW